MSLSVTAVAKRCDGATPKHRHADAQQAHLFLGVVAPAALQRLSNPKAMVANGNCADAPVNEIFNFSKRGDQTTGDHG